MRSQKENSEVHKKEKQPSHNEEIEFQSPIFV